METWGKRLRQVLDEAGSRDLTFALMLWALRSVLRPYVGFVHDARLYALQVANRVRGGWHADDLFFAFGSQDDYSLFSILLSPLASWLGVATAFLCVYLAGTILLAVAEVKLVRRLIPDRRIGSLALVLLAVSDLPYGGHGIFHVHEPFLTARLPAQVLVLWSLSWILSDRPLPGLAGLGAALLIHPLNAVGGLCVGLALTAGSRLTTRSLLWSGFGVVAGVVLLLGSPWAVGNLTPMDGPWLQAVRDRSPHCFPSLWHADDWLRIVASLIILTAACRWTSVAGRRLTVLVVILAVGGVAVSIVAEATQAAFLLQGQAYRSLWLSQWLTLPLGVLVADRLWRSPAASARCAAPAVIAVTGNVLFLDVLDLATVGSAVRLWLVLTVAWAVLLRGRGGQLGQPRGGRLPEAIAAGLVSAVVLLSATNLIVNLDSNWHRPVDRVQLLSMAIGSCSALVLAAAGIAGLGALRRCGQWLGGRWESAGWIAAGLSLLAGSSVLLLQRSDAYRDRFEPGHPDAAFVAQVIGAQGASRPSEVDQVYWAVDPELIWLELRANCYYDFAQVAGIIFSRETALEGRRRARLVRPFEVASHRRFHDRRFHDRPDAGTEQSAFLGSVQDVAEPTREDVQRLAADPALDWIILDRPFQGLDAATNGSVFVYDCRRLRTDARVTPVSGTP